MTAARIILWRHGRTEWNVVNRFQGQADIPLDDVGYAQADRAAAVLADYRPSSLYSSDLTRCHQTAETLAQRTGLQITTDKRLREIHVGSSRSRPTSGCVKFTSARGRACSARRSRRLTLSWRGDLGRARTYAAPQRARAPARSPTACWRC